MYFIYISQSRGQCTKVSDPIFAGKEGITYTFMCIIYTIRKVGVGALKLATAYLRLCVRSDILRGVSGNAYHGEWKEDRKHGEGVVHYVSGVRERIIGKWIKDEMIVGICPDGVDAPYSVTPVLTCSQWYVDAMCVCMPSATTTDIDEQCSKFTFAESGLECMDSQVMRSAVAA